MELQFLLLVAYVAVWAALIVGGLRVIWFAWVGPRRLDAIERKLDALANAVEAVSISLERHIDQR